jgi:bifunctional non-homologous end joining protein LigD
MLEQRSKDSLVPEPLEVTSAADLHKRLKLLIPDLSALCQAFAHKGICVQPKLFAEIGSRESRAAGKVRHPLSKELRENL